MSLAPFEKDPLLRRIRSLLLSTAALWMLLCGGLASGCTAPSERQPNVLLIFTDDHRADALGAAGNPYIETPTLDSLADVGFRLRNTYVMGGHHGAICAPSRAMLMTGRSLFHVYDNLDTVRTFPQQLREAGYRTFGTGKWHNSGESFVKSFDKGRHVFLGGMSDHMKVPVRDLLSDGTFSDVDSMGFSSTLFADAAVAFLDEYAASEAQEPFLAYVAFTAPHDPRQPPEVYRTAYAPEGVPLPPNFMPLHPFNLGPATMTIRDEQLAAWPRSTKVVRSQISEYYGLVTHMDVEIGRILRALRRNGLVDNTIVIVAGDNGLALGSHGLMGKQSLYEHSTRVPLIIAGQGIRHGTSDELTYLHDIAPTIFDLTGVEGFARMDGTSLAGLWGDGAHDLRPVLFTAYTNAMRAVRNDRFKLIQYPRIDHVQLFDLTHDPYELNNLADDSAYAEQLDQMVNLLQREQERSDDPLAPGADPRDDAPVQAGEPLPLEFDYSKIERRVDRWQPEEIIQKYFLPDSSFVADRD